MLTIQIVNDRTGTDTAANYTYRVLVNRDEIDRGVIKGHDRSRHWTVLVRQLIEEKEGEGWIRQLDVQRRRK